MVRGFSSRFSNRANWLTGLEALEPRRVMDGFGCSPIQFCVPGDSNGDGQFDEQDLVGVFQTGKYNTSAQAGWSDGDWNGDGLFDSGDLVAVFQAGTYLKGKLAVDLSSHVTEIPAYPGSFGPPIVITSAEQLNGVIHDQATVDAIVAETDFDQQSLLYFSWSGSGGDSLVGEAKVVDGAVNVQFKFSYGLTDDIRPHLALVAIPKEATWDIEIEDREIHDDTTDYQFGGDSSQLIVKGGFAGVSDEYRIEGSLTLTRNADGSASFSQVNASLRGDGLSSLDGKSLDSVLNLSGLTGLQTSSSSIVFSGQHESGSGVIRLYVSVNDDSLSIRGGDQPPCCDFFQHEMIATLSAQTTPAEDAD